MNKTRKRRHEWRTVGDSGKTDTGFYNYDRCDMFHIFGFMLHLCPYRSIAYHSCKCAVLKEALSSVCEICELISQPSGDQRVLLLYMVSVWLFLLRVHSFYSLPFQCPVVPQRTSRPLLRLQRSSLCPGWLLLKTLWMATCWVLGSSTGPTCLMEVHFFTCTRLKDINSIRTYETKYVHSSYDVEKYSIYNINTNIYIHGYKWHSPRESSLYNKAFRKAACFLTFLGELKCS